MAACKSGLFMQEIKYKIITFSGSIEPYVVAPLPPPCHLHQIRCPLIVIDVDLCYLQLPLLPTVPSRQQLY
jgi:hypothetical protein